MRNLLHSSRLEKDYPTNDNFNDLLGNRIISLDNCNIGIIFRFSLYCAMRKYISVILLSFDCT